jgi:hypothetical protein
MSAQSAERRLWPSATAPTGLFRERLWCQLLVGIVYSSIMIGICPELLGSDRI